jgi:hypothetical protein
MLKQSTVVYQPQVSGKYQSPSGDGTDSEHSSINTNDCEIGEQSDTKTADGRSKQDKTPNAEPFLGNQSVNVAIGDPSDIRQVVSTVMTFFNSSLSSKICIINRM